MNTSQTRHPLTGRDYREPIYVTRDGRPRYMIGGGSEPLADTPPGTPPADTPPADQPPADQPPADAPPADAPPADAPPAADNVKVFDEAYVKKVREEAAKYRTEGQQAKAVLDAINKALNPEAEPTDKVDPVKLQEQLTGTTTAHTSLQREHQVLLSAVEAGADHAALLDSRSFLAKVAGLDPAADDFAAQVKAAVDKAVADNPKLKTGQVPGASAADHPGGAGGGGGKPKSLEDAIAARMAV